MKKIMIALAAVALAAGAQAAAVYWTATNVYAGNTTDKVGGIAYFLTTSMASTDSWASLTSAKDFQDALAGKYSWTPSTAGTYSVTAANAVSNATLGLQDEKAYTAYLLIFDTATITDTSKYYITNTKDLSTMTGTSNASVAFGTQKTASQAAGGWQTVAVPEPTSGLLLVLGMAGLARADGGRGGVQRGKKT